MDLRPANFVECCLLIDKAVPSIEIGIAKRECRRKLNTDPCAAEI